MFTDDFVRIESLEQSVLLLLECPGNVKILFQVHHTTSIVFSSKFILGK